MSSQVDTAGSPAAVLGTQPPVVPFWVTEIRERVETMLSSREAGYLLEKLCVDLGFCLPPDIQRKLQETPPADIDSFTDAVVEAEGFDPEYMDRRLRSQVRQLVAESFARCDSA